RSSVSIRCRFPGCPTARESPPGERCPLNRNATAGVPWLGGDGLPQFLQPHRRLGIARRPPVPSRREGAARADLRAVGDRAAFELARLEEAVEEHPQPLLDRRQVVFVAL